ncbi:TetR/AcrR family transcriptional regulator [Mycobacterium crocinum]|uniref:TetR/AcrR family transcriptional regulator n=1 Tax=Mycolicibacterium crocinum TaxID=388459 RepID=A0ABY3TJQ2_9MYCO|nr:TetR/AcrR family transcriptional regulator [Mycolicibacterium crocinum]MCV7218026.1 TetR/AcrR family transcriptional regulator [Mycolicibacterium crocinum]ULN40521.1 TetR/AcrR family transcriptional regulator [Mycolicibacterium crocinum]
MARPPKFDRDEALRSAMHLFWERGFEGASVNDLTEVMGISAPSLYAAFGDKQALYDAAVDLYELTAVVPPALEAPTAREVFEQMLDRAVKLYTRPNHPRGCFVIADPQLRQRRGVGRAAIADRLRRAQRAGDLAREVNVEALTDYVDTVLRGLSAKARDGASRKQLRAAADLALQAWPTPTTGRVPSSPR